MSNPSYLLKRGTRYYCRVSVPVELQPSLGKKQIWKSLRVSDYSKACQLVKYEAYRILGIYSGMQTRTLTKSDIEVIAQFIHELFSDGLLEAEARKISIILGQEKISEPEKEEMIAHNIEGLKKISENIKEELRRNDCAGEETVLSIRLSPIYGTLNYGSVLGKALLKRCKQERLKATLDTIQKLESGDYIFSHTNNFKPLEERLAVNGDKYGVPPKAEKSATFGQLIDRFNSASEVQEKSDGVKKKYQTHQRLLLELLGKDTPLTEVTKDLVRSKVRDALAIIPKNYNKITEFKGKSLVEIIELSKDSKKFPRLTVGSKNDYLEHLSELFRWANSEGLVTFNPADGLRFKENKFAKDKRDAFSDDEINKILSHPKFIALKDSHRDIELYWVILISLFTGMRLGEILQLSVKDVISLKEGIWELSINAEEGKTVKNKQSVRKVVVPESLIRLGFISYVTSVKSANGNDSKVFPRYKVKGDKISDAMSKRANRFLGAIGVKTDSSISFHSFRHTFRDAIRNSDLTDEEAKSLRSMSGWVDEKVHENYGSGMDSSKLYKVINKLNYGGIRIEHLFELENTNKSKGKLASKP